MSNAAAISLFESIVQGARDDAISYTKHYTFNTFVDDILEIDSSILKKKAVFFNGIGI